MQVYGIDLSMEKFDINFIGNDGKEKQKEVKNGLVTISKFLSKVPKDAILCAENTGAYGDLLVYLCNQVKISIALVPGYTIKHSLGLLKGKDDPLDARRIREYGERFTDKLKYVEYDEECIVECERIADQLEKNNIRVEVDDRSISVGKKVRAAEKLWTPLIIVIGDREKGAEKVPVRIRREREEAMMSLEELVNHINEKTEGMPKKPLFLPRMASKQPIFSREV